MRNLLKAFSASRISQIFVSSTMYPHTHYMKGMDNSAVPLHSSTKRTTAYHSLPDGSNQNLCHSQHSKAAAGWAVSRLNEARTLDQLCTTYEHRLGAQTVCAMECRRYLKPLRAPRSKSPAPSSNDCCPLLCSLPPWQERTAAHPGQEFLAPKAEPLLWAWERPQGTRDSLCTSRWGWRP